MSNTSAKLGYTLHDILTRIVPGAVLISPLIVAYSLNSEVQPPELSTPVAVLTGLGLLLVGEGITTLLSGESVPPHLIKEIYASTGRDDVLTPSMKIGVFLQNLVPGISRSKTVSQELGFNFRQYAEADLEIDFEQHHPDDIYHYLRVYLGEDLLRTTLRKRSLYIFASNLQASAIFSMLLYLVIFAVSLFNQRHLSITTVAMFVSAVIGLGSLVALQFFLGISRQYVRALLREYRMATLGLK